MQETSICYIVGAGEHYDPPPTITSEDYVIAADGGYTYLLQRNLPCHLLVGDFDSFSGSLPEGTNTLRLPKEKDDTDMVAALRAGWERGYRLFHILGGTGGRLDHTLANLQCIADLAKKGGRGYLHDRDTLITAVKDTRILFHAGARGTLSVFAHTNTATGVDEWGLKYPLDNATVTNTYPVGVSNEFTGVPSGISVRDGTLIIIYPKNTQEVDICERY